MTEKRHAGVRKFNRAVYNPIMRLIAGKFIYSLVYHTGRRSGTTYNTPVLASLGNGCIYIPLPYGTDTDWYLNICAAGGCQVKIGGMLYQTCQPDVVSGSVALPSFSGFAKAGLEAAKVNQFLRLKIGSR